EGFAAADDRLPACVNVVVGVDAGRVAEEDEIVGVAAVAEGRAGLRAKLLAGGGEPSLGALPRGEVAVKLVGAKGAVTARKQNAGCAERGIVSGFAAGRLGAVVAVGDESSGEVAGAGSGLAPFAVDKVGDGGLLVFAIAA